MFRFFRRNREALKRYLLIFFLSVVSIGMVITLAPIPGDVNQMQANVLATIDGQNITADDLRHTIQSRMRNSSLNDPRIVSGIAGSLLDQMILSRAVETQAQKLGMKVTEQELLQSLQSIPWLYNEGKFIGMDAYQNQIVQATGMSAPQFEAQLRQRMLFEKVRNVVTDGVEVTPAEVHEEFVRRNGKVRVEYAVFDPAQFVKDVEVTPQALEGFFSKDKARYTVPQQRRVRYVVIDQDHVRASATIDDTQLKTYYNTHLANYRVPDRVKVAHILFKTTGKSPAEVSEIGKKARGVLAQIKAGTNFGELAKKHSEDTSAQSGGEIGWIVRGQTVKEFEGAAFSLHPGQVSDLIKTIYGIHIVKVEDRQIAHLQSFDEVKGQIRTDLEKQKLATAQQSLAQQVQQQVTSNPKDFEGLAQKLGLEPRETTLFKYNQPVPDLGKSDALENLSFQLREGEVGTPISVPRGLAVIQVAQIVPEHVPTLSEVRPQVEQDFKAEQSRVMASQKAQDLSTKGKGGGDFKKLAKAAGVTVKESKDFTQQDNVEDTIPGSALSTAFTMKPGETSDPITVGGNQVVFRVSARSPANEADFAGQQPQIAEELLEKKRNVAFELYSENLKQELIRKGTLKLNDKAMKAFLASYSRGARE